LLGVPGKKQKNPAITIKLNKMSKVKDLVSKIENDELSDLQELVKNINQYQLQIGGFEAQKHDLLHQLVGIKQSLNDLQKNLEDKYGNVSIDIQSGEIKENDSPKKD
jgi:allophanate hydrolase subunit 1